MEVVAADAEIERAAEMRNEPEFLTQLPGMLIRKIFCYEPVAAAQLRVAEDAIRNAGESITEPIWIVPLRVCVSPRWRTANCAHRLTSIKTCSPATAQAI